MGVECWGTRDKRKGKVYDFVYFLVRTKYIFYWPMWLVWLKYTKYDIIKISFSTWEPHLSIWYFEKFYIFLIFLTLLTFWSFHYKISILPYSILYYYSKQKDKVREWLIGWTTNPLPSGARVRIPSLSYLFFHISL